MAPPALGVTGGNWIDTGCRPPRSAGGRGAGSAGGGLLARGEPCGVASGRIWVASRALGARRSRAAINAPAVGKRSAGSLASNWRRMSW